MHIALDDPDFFVDDVEPVYRWLRSEAPVYRCDSTGLRALSKHADILRVGGRDQDRQAGGAPQGRRQEVAGAGNLEGTNVKHRYNLRLLPGRRARQLPSD
jgi:hypothetical protein